MAVLLVWRPAWLCFACVASCMAVFCLCGVLHGCVAVWRPACLCCLYGILHGCVAVWRPAWLFAAWRPAWLCCLCGKSFTDAVMTLGALRASSTQSVPTQPNCLPPSPSLFPPIAACVWHVGHVQCAGTHAGKHMSWWPQLQAAALLPLLAYVQHVHQVPRLAQVGVGHQWRGRGVEHLGSRGPAVHAGRGGVAQPAAGPGGAHLERLPLESSTLGLEATPAGGPHTRRQLKAARPACWPCSLTLEVTFC